MVSVAMLNVIMLNVVMLSVVALSIEARLGLTMPLHVQTRLGYIVLIRCKHPSFLINWYRGHLCECTNKRQLAGQILSRVFNSRRGRVYVIYSFCY